MKRSVVLALAFAACGPDAPSPPRALATVPDSPASFPDGLPGVYADTPSHPPAPRRVPPPEAAVAECDPNYEPCVPVASDVDCAGGSGNGPAYVRGPVRVIGRDIHDLDRDGDGIGCDR